MSKGRIYAVTFAASISAAQDAFSILPATQKPCELAGLCLNQYGVADVGDAQEECLRYSVVRGNTTTGSGGSSATGVPVDPGSAAAAFTARVNDTTVASAGTAVTLHEGAFNVRSGDTFWWPEGMEPKAANATFLCVRLPAPADAITIVGTAYIREL